MRRILPLWWRRCGRSPRTLTVSMKFATEPSHGPGSSAGRKLLAVPERSMTRPRALFLTPEEPRMGTGGGGLRSASLLAYLRDKYAVQTVTFTLQSNSKSTAARIWRNTLRLARRRPPLFDRFSG